MPNPYGNINYRVSQPFGPSSLSAEPPLTWNGVYYPRFHRGIDLVAVPWNAPVYSISNGVVYSAKTDTDGAIYVIVHADDGFWFCYWHLSALSVKAGQRVSIGTRLGSQGSTGNSTGNHLHLEIHKPGAWKGLLSMTPVDPNPYLKTQEDNDVTPTEDFQRVFIAVAYRWPTPEETQAWTSSGLEPYAWVQQHAPNPAVEAEKVRSFQACWITLAWRWPTDDETRAWQQSGMAAYEYTQKNAPSPALEDAKIQTFRESWITRATQWPTKTTIDDWQHTSEPAYSYVQHHAPSPTETSLNQQIEQISRNNTDLHLELENQDKQIEADALLMKSQEAQIKALKEGKPVDEVEVPEEPVGGDTPPNGGLLGWIIELLQQIFGGTKK